MPRADVVRPASIEFDVVLCGDLCHAGESDVRRAGEIRALAGAGLRVAVSHVPTADGTRHGPETQAEIAAGRAWVLDPDWWVSTRLLVFHSPGTLGVMPAHVSRIDADRVVLVADRELTAKTVLRAARLAAFFGPVSWAPTGPPVRTLLRQLQAGPLLRRDWLPAILPGEATRQPDDRPRAVGIIFSDPGEIAALLSAMGVLPAFRAVCYGPGRPTGPLPPGWTHLDPADVTLDRFIGRTDIVACFPSAPLHRAVPAATLASAIAAGRAVLMPQGEGQQAPGTLDCSPQTFAATVERLRAALGSNLRRQAAGRSSVAATAAGFGRAVLEMIGPVRAAAPPLPIASKGPGPVRRALLVASNGVGVGHVSRLLAVARRLPRDVEPVFWSMAQAVSLIESFGFHADYTPSYREVDSDISVWDEWFAAELDGLIEAHRPGVVVFDGNNPTEGLVHTVGRRSVGLAWIRQGMMGAALMPGLARSVYFDRIIEPGELATELDRGATVGCRDEAVTVAPIRLLDSREFLSRADARRLLGIHPAKTAVLIQLGAGSNRDIISVTEQILEELSRRPDVQPCILEWSNAAATISGWPGVMTLTGFPIAKYFNAFDFSFSAGGYSTFHDIVAAGLPSIFVPNCHPTMDDQQGRAEYAEQQGLGLHLRGDRMYELPQMIDVLFSPAARDFLRGNCRRIPQGNGARDAARLIREIAAP